MIKALFSRLINPFCFLLLLSSCGIYNSQNTPIALIAEKGELQIDGGASITTVAANASVSYGVTNTIAAQIYGNAGADNISYSHIAIGPYFRLKNDWVIELQAGYGLGRGEYSKDDVPSKLKADYSLMFSQINLGHKQGAHRKIEYGAALKLGVINANTKYWDNSIYNLSSSKPTIEETFNDQLALIEPQAFVRLGKNKLRLALKVGYNWLHRFNERKYDFPIQGFNFGISLNYKIR